MEEYTAQLVDGTEFIFDTQYRDASNITCKSTADGNKIAVWFLFEHTYDGNPFEMDDGLSKIHHYPQLSKCEYQEAVDRVLGPKSGALVTTKGALCDRYEHSGTALRLVVDRGTVHFQHEAWDVSHNATLIEFSDDQRYEIRHTASKKRLEKALEIARRTVNIFNGNFKCYGCVVMFGRVVDGYLRSEVFEDYEGYFDSEDASEQAGMIAARLLSDYNNCTIPLPIF